MFSFKKSAFGRRLTGIRNRFGSRSRRSVDVEAAASASSSERRLAPNEGVRLSNPTENPREYRVSSGSSADSTVASRSEPILGPQSNPDDFVLVGRNGRVLPKARSAGAVIIAPVGGGSDRDAVLNSNTIMNEQPSGLRRRTTRDSSNAGNQGAHTSCASGDAPNINVEALNDQANQDGVGAMELLQVGTAAPLVVVPEVVNRPQYLHGYIDVMYMTGTSRVTPRGWRGQELSTWVVNNFFLIIFCIGTALSCFNSCSDAKYSLLRFLAGDGLGWFVDFSFNMACLLTKAYASYLFTMKIKEVDRMLNLIAEYDMEYDPQAKCHCNHWKWVILGICVGTMIMSVAGSIFANGFEEWSIDNVGSEKSFDFSRDIYLWKHQTMENQSIMLARMYGNPENYTGWYACAETATEIASYFQMGTLRDLVLVAVFVIFVIVIAFMKGVKETTENLPRDDIEACRMLQAEREKVWKQYRKVRLVIATLNLVLETLLILLHTDNLLLYGYFATLCIERDEATVMICFHYGFNIIKAEITYLLAERISAQNTHLRRWIRNWSAFNGKIVVDGIEYDAGMLVDELEKEPIGIGTGIFLINQEFRAKFVTMMLSLVFFLADNKTK